jgi:aspartate/methionine/tyrosine aminotransferase
MFNKLTEKISKFTALHPQVVMYGISLGVTLGITLSIAFAVSLMNPHDVFAVPGSTFKSHAGGGGG